VLESAKLVDYHVSYSSVEGFGYSDAIGCPIFSQAAVVALEPPVVEDIVESGQVVGFALTQDFRSEFWPLPCNYRYAQRYEFYTDGRFRVIGENLGRGCGNDGTYRMVLRIAPAGPSSVAAWDGSSHVPWTTEQWIRQTTATPPASGETPYLLDTQTNRYAVAPVWSDPARSDSAWFYVTRRHPDRDEGDADLITIGPCCNTDYRQGPEKFIEPSPEPLLEGGEPTELVIWYVPELVNDDTRGQEYCWADFDIQEGVYTPYSWPCGAGLDFVPSANR